MSISAFLYPILAASATLMASSAAGEFAKGVGKSTFEAIKARLQGKHGVGSLALLDQDKEKPAYADTIKVDLDAANLDQDSDLLSLVETLLTAIEAVPKDQKVNIALDVKEIRAQGNQLFRNIEGIRADKIISDGDQTFDGIKAGKD